MATLNIRCVPDEVVARIHHVADTHGRLVEDELRELLVERYGQTGDAPRREVVLRMTSARWPELPNVSGEEIEAWIETGR